MPPKKNIVHLVNSAKNEDDSESSRISKIEQIKQGHFKIIISTGQLFGEGIDIFDYRDSKIDYFEKMFKQRKRYYNKLLK